MATLAQQQLFRLLDRTPLGHLGLIDDAGRPEVLPIVFARVGETLFSPIDGKPKGTAPLARLRYVERCPAVALTLDHYAADWRRLWWIKLDIQASVAVGQHPAWDAAVSALLSKYPQYRETALFKGEPTFVVMKWQRVRCWAAAEDGFAAIGL